MPQKLRHLGQTGPSTGPRRDARSARLVMYVPMSPGERPDLRRADALRNRARILDAARFLLAQSPSATLADIAAATGVSRSTLYRRFADREELIAALEEQPQDAGLAGSDPLPPGRLGCDRPVDLDAIHVFDVVPPAALPEQLVAEAVPHTPAEGCSGITRPPCVGRPLSHSLSQTRPNGAPPGRILQISNACGLAGFAGKSGDCPPRGPLPHTREVAGSNPAAPTTRKPR